MVGIDIDVSSQEDTEIANPILPAATMVTNTGASSLDNTAAFKIANNSTGDVTITLADGKTNTLKSGKGCAGLQKNGDGENIGKLTIKGETAGTGVLNATSGNPYEVRSSGAGIGSSEGFNTANIEIKGGKINATSCEGAGGAGIGGGKNGSSNNIKISGGSVKASSIGCTPTDGTANATPVYLLELAVDGTSAVTINGNTNYPKKHFDENKLYVYLPAKTVQAPNEVTVGNETTKYTYDTTNSKWLVVVDAPEADTTKFTYNGEEHTYTLAESDYYTITDNTAQTNAGTYTVTVALKENCVWSDDGAIDDKEYTFTIKKAELTVTAESCTVKFGNPLPATIDYTITGLKGADTKAVLDNANLSFSYGDGVIPSALGEYDIITSGDAEIANYKITYVDGTLTITEKAVQTVTASDVTLTYGDTDGKIIATAIGAISYEVATGADVISVDENGNITILKAGAATVTESIIYRLWGFILLLLKV